MFNSNQKTLWVDVILELPLNKNLTINKLKDDVSDHVTLFVQQSLFSSQYNSVQLCASLGYKWFLNKSSAKYQLCEAPNVHFFPFSL